MASKDKETPEVQRSTELHPGPYWPSFEQFRIRGGEALRKELRPNHVGRLNVKGDEFVIMRSEAFNTLRGTAREIDRLTNQIHLIRQAVRLLQESGGSELAVQHVADLVAQLPHPAGRRPKKTELVFDADEQLLPSDYAPEDLDFELDPAKIPRPAWSRG